MDIEKKEEEALRSVSAGDEEPRKRKRRWRGIICWSVIAVIVTVALILLILSLTVFKAKDPVLTVNSVTLQDLDVSVNPLTFRVSLNVSIDIDISINNPNKVSVKYRNSSTSLRYKGKDVGDVPIPAGKLGSDDTKQLNLTLTIFADRLLSDSDLYRDVLTGNLPISTYVRISAKVRVLFINIHVVSTSTCDVNIDIQTSTVTNQTCHYKNKL